MTPTADIHPSGALGLGRAVRGARSDSLGFGIVTAVVTSFVVLPIAALAWASFAGGVGPLVAAITSPQALAALRLTVVASAIVAVVGVVMGTLVAWVIERDRFPGKWLLDAIVDLPFALPTVVAGVTLLTLYGAESPIGLDLAFRRIAIVLAMLFVTFPFVVRAVQPVLRDLDGAAEAAAGSLGASPFTVFRRVTLPAIAPAIATGGGLAFAKALGEFGAVVLVSGNLPFETEVSAVYIFGLVQSDEPALAAASSLVLLTISVVVLLAIDILRSRSRA